VLDQRDVHPHQLVAQLDPLRGLPGERRQLDEEGAGGLAVGGAVAWGGGGPAAAPDVRLGRGGVLGVGVRLCLGLGLGLVGRVGVGLGLVEPVRLADRGLSRLVGIVGTLGTVGIVCEHPVLRLLGPGVLGLRG
jgi:hypothetical protein